MTVATAIDTAMALVTVTGTVGDETVVGNGVMIEMSMPTRR
jgi:hypothetical protein